MHAVANAGRVSVVGSLSDHAMVPALGWSPSSQRPYGGLPVTLRVRQVEQPRGGFLPLAVFDRFDLSDPVALRPRENRSPQAVGSAVDYLTRFVTSGRLLPAFSSCLEGARAAGGQAEAMRLLERVDGLSDGSIRAVCDLVVFDQAARAGRSSMPVSRVTADVDTCWNIRRMVQRSCRFLDAYGPAVWFGPSFDGGYTRLVSYGDGDLLTRDTLWDFKTSGRVPTRDNTLQLLCYWLLGLHSTHAVYRRVRRLGFYNPRLDVVWLLPVSDIPEDVVREVCVRVLGYEDRWRFLDV